eukprot:NODE_570_length_6597_cov_0.382271.p4 type:complete len:125 gc:universal NODE_570_length_6597_cov_0.382271:1783-2157(+)
MVTEQPVYVKHVFSYELLKISKSDDRHEFLEWHIDTKENDLMKNGLSKVVIIVPKVTENKTHLIWRHCSIQEGMLSYSAIKKFADIPRDKLSLIRSTKVEDLMLYPMVFLRSSTKIANTHIGFD